MPFAGFDSFEDCKQKAPKDVRDKDAYCGKIKHETEDKLDGPAEMPDRKLTLAVGGATVATVGALLALHDTPNSPHREHMRGGRGTSEATMVSSPERRISYLRDKPVEQWDDQDANMAVEMARQGSPEAQRMYDNYVTGGQEPAFEDEDEDDPAVAAQPELRTEEHEQERIADRAEREVGEERQGEEGRAPEHAPNEVWTGHGGYQPLKPKDGRTGERQRGSLQPADPETAQGDDSEAQEESGEHAPGEVFTGWAGYQPLRDSVGKATVATADALLALHDTPGSPHRQHMDGGKRPAQLPEPSGEMSPRELRAEVKQLARKVPRELRDTFFDRVEWAEQAARGGNPAELQQVVEEWKADPYAAFKGERKRAG